MRQEASVLDHTQRGTAHRPPRAPAMTLDDRCENWAECYRDRMRRGRAMSFEGRSQSTRGNEVEWSTKCQISGKWLGFGSTNKTIARDWTDAEEINGAWQSIPDGYHQFLLAAWHVRKWSPGKCVREAREFDGRDHDRGGLSDSEFTANIGMAHALLAEQLQLPAVFRRVRLAGRVRIALDLDVWLAADATTSADVTNNS
jgi:hypothetical protein